MTENIGTVSVTAEAAGSSPVVPAISNQALREMASFRRGHKKVPKRHKLKSRQTGSATLPIPIPGSVTVEASGFSGRRSLLIIIIGDEKRYHRGLRSALFGGHGLGVGVESDADRRMPHQFLHDLEFGTCSPQQCGVRSAKGMPPNPLRDAQLFHDGTDVMTKKLLSPIRLLSSILGTGEHPTLRCSIGRSAIPAAQGTDQMIVKRHGFL